MILYRENTNLIRNTFTDANGNPIITSITMKATLLNLDKTPAGVAEITDLAMPHVANGVYEAQVAATFAPAKGEYLVRVTAAEGLKKYVPASVRDRDESQ